MASIIDSFLRFLVFALKIFKLRITNHILSKLVILVFVFISFYFSFIFFNKERDEVIIKYNHWDERISAKSNIDGVFNFLKKEHPFLNSLWLHLQNKKLQESQSFELSKTRKIRLSNDFKLSFHNFAKWVEKNGWPTLTRTTKGLLPIVKSKNYLNLYEIKTLYAEKDNYMKNIVDKSTLDSYYKAQIFVRLNKLNEQLNKAISTKISTMAKINEYQSLKITFRDIFMEIQQDIIQLQNEKIRFYNSYKKYCLFFNLYLSIILLFRFAYFIYLQITGRKIDFKKIRTSQLIIDLLFELEEIGSWLSSKDSFKIEHEKEKGYINITFVIGGIELDKHSLHYQHTLKNGINRSLYDIFIELKERSVNFNCSNYFKENDEPHSFTISLEIRTSK